MDPGGDDHAGPSSSWSRDSQHVTSVSSGSFTPSVHGLVSQQQELPGFSHAQFDGQQFQLTDGSNLPYRITLPTGQSAVFQLPHTTFDRLAPSTEYQEATSGGGDIMHAYQEGHVIPLQVLDPNIHRTLQASYTNLQLLQPVSSSVPRVMTPSRSQSELSSNVTSTLSRNQSDLGLAREADPVVQSHLMPVDSVSSGAMAMLNPTLTTASSHPTLHSLMTQGEATASFSAHHQRTGGQSSMISNHSEAGATYGGHMEAGPSYSSHVEAGTSEASPLVVHGNADQEVDQTVSSLNLVLGNEAAAQQPPVRAPMLERLESYQNEPDTTQGDSPTCINQEDDFDDPEVNNLAGLDSSMPVSSGQHHMLEQASVGEDSVDVETTGNIDTTGIDDSTTNEGVDSSFMNGDLNVDDDSNIDQATASWSRPTRKSSRLLSIEKDTGPPVRPQYVSKPYNTSELWCEECQQSYESECTAHRLLPVYDKVVLSRAWSSLPGMLQIFRIADDPNAIGVFAKKMVPKRTQFGPFVGELVPDMDSVTNKEFPLQLIKADSQEMYFNTSDENKCNWMMFVRAAQNFKEQNCVVYQHGEDIFFSVTREIEPREELKVWYAAHYAEKLGKPVFKADLEDQLNLEGMDNQWPCFECNKRFKTSAMLQRHLLTHESAEFDDGEDAKSSKRKSVPQKPGAPRKRGRPPKKQDEIKAETSWGEGGGAGTSGISEGANGSTFQSWKKMKKTMYLNKLKQSRYSSAIKRSIKSLYKKQNNAGTGWVCTHCDLTFDDATLLNLHTLTHAAEDVGLGEVGEGTSDLPQATEQKFDSASATIPWTSLKCPVCDLEFTNKQELIQHAGTHARSRRARLINPLKPYKCTQCWKAFSNEDRLEKHMLCHGSEDSKPLPCSVCYKRFMNNSALACHMKTHSEKKYYECPVCHMGFDMVQVMREHSAVHCFNGVYPCPICSKTFEDFNDIRKHMRFFHPEKQFPCDQCGKVFPRPDKLKLHMLRHSEHREFMCETCGRQFKRKDKLKEHVKRMHTAEREASMQLNSTPNLSNIKKKFTPKVSPSEYHRFIYKCHSCLMGFKRRGMLVNHLAKRHPDVKPESVPELNLPILKTQRDYYCQYCDKVYKSSSKRKAHIMKNHPGAQLPASGRIKQIFEVEQVLQNFPDPTFSQTVGSVTAMPHPCEHCHKQYASKAKLLQHQRKKHPRLAPPMIVRRSMENKQQLDTLMLQQPENDQQGGQPMENSQAADLLTQAMSELTQSLTEYRPQPGGTVEYQLTPRLTPHPGQHTSTIDISHLGQITHLHYTPQGQVQINTGSGSPQQIQVAVSNPQGIQVGSPQPIHVAVPQSQGLTQPIQVAVPNTQGLPQPIQVAVPNSQGLPQSIQVAVSNTQGGIPVTYIPSTWTQAGNFANYR